MAQNWAKKLYASAAWQKCREGYIQSVNGLCEVCLSKDRLTPGLIVHHKIVLTPENINDPSVTLNWDHLRYVCNDCHETEHHGEHEVVRDGLKFNSNGDLIQA